MLLAMQTPVSIIGFGSNKSLGKRPPVLIVKAAFEAVSQLGTDAVLSPLYRSAAWPDPSGPFYINAVGSIRTLLSAEALLEVLLAIEAGFSRIRSDDPQKRYAPRTLDLDLLDHQGEVRQSDRLTLPHPRLQDRGFVLQPMIDIRPDWQHPESGKKIQELWECCPEETHATPYSLA